MPRFIQDVDCSPPAGLATCSVEPTAGGTTPAEVHTPGTKLVLDTPQSASAVVDQATFRVLSMWGNGTAPTCRP